MHPKTKLFGAVCAVAFCGAFVGDGKSWRRTGMSRMQRGLEGGRVSNGAGCQRERERGVKRRFLHLHQFYKANQLIVLITNIFRTINNVNYYTNNNVNYNNNY